MAKLNDLQRAQRAHQQVEQYKNNANAKEYRQHLQQLPAMILANGLGQTLAFLASKGGVQKDIAEHLANLLAGEQCLELLGKIERMNSLEYRKKTREAVAYAEWLKRFSAAIIPKPREEAHAAQQ